MGNSKVIFGNETLIDLTGDTVTPDTLLAGTTAHNRSGNQIVGTATVPEELDDLTDVNLISPADGDLLQYDSTSGKWVNSAKIPQKVAGLQKTGCMNVLPNYLTSQVVGGVTLDVNNNGIITANSSGAVASNVIVNMLVRYNVGAGNKHFLPNGIYKLLGSNNSRVHLSTFVTKNSAYTSLAETNSAEGAVFTVNGDDSSSDGAYVGVSIQIDRGDAISNVVIKPMITPDLSATYDDYQPYSMTNRELTEAVTTKTITSISGTPATNNVQFVSGEATVYGKVVTLKVVVKSTTPISANTYMQVSLSGIPTPAAAQTSLFGFKDTLILMGNIANSNKLFSIKPMTGSLAADQSITVNVTYISE